MASPATLTDEEEQQLAEDLRTKFIQEHSDDIDPRDLKRLQAELHHALKFIRHNRGKFDNAYNHMVESYKWRKSFGINDIKYEDIDENLWKSGMALNHGEDRQGNPIAILNIHMHKKDSKKALMLHKWIAFCYEMHCRLYPNKKMLMIFDMTGAGLAQMDMDLVRFVVNSFKIYFPNILAWLLVYNMPWVLQAAWKIVQGWLSEGAASKVKFITNENIQEYISPEHLLTKYGGYDQWQFVYEAERDKMLQLINSFHDIAAEDDPQEDSLIDDDRLTPVAEEEEEQDGEEEGNYRQRGEGGGRERGGGKQVRFSSGLPPTRQSRFGRQDEDEIPRSVSPDQQMLQRGSSTSSDVRRRQVTRLMSLQDSGKATSRSADRRRISDPSVGDPQSSIASLMGEEDVHRSSNGTPPSLRRTGSSTIGDLMVSPWTLLQFPGKKDEESVCTLTLTNTSEKTVAYKIKTTAPLRYKVRPNLALIDAKAVAKVKVMLTSGSSSDDIIQDKFLVQTYTFDSKNSVPDENRLSSFWKGLPHGAIKEHRMRCRRMTSTAGKSTMKSESFSEGGVSGGGAHTMVAAATPRKTSEAQVTRASGGKSINVEREVARLVQVNNDLCKRMSRLQKLNYLTILLLLVLIAVVYLY